MKSLILLLVFVASSKTLALPWNDFDRQDASGCSCDALGTNPDALSICDPTTKQCDCNCAIEGTNCDTCTDMHYNFPECETNRKDMRNIKLALRIIFIVMQLVIVIQRGQPVWSVKRAMVNVLAKTMWEDDNAILVMTVSKIILTAFVR